MNNNLKLSQVSQPRCVLCLDVCIGHGHNPFPLATSGVCCNVCNLEVLQARIMEQVTQVRFEPEKHETGYQLSPIDILRIVQNEESDEWWKISTITPSWTWSRPSTPGF